MFTSGRCRAGLPGQAAGELGEPGSVQNRAWGSQAGGRTGYGTAEGPPPGPGGGGRTACGVLAGGARRMVPRRKGRGTGQPGGAQWGSGCGACPRPRSELLTEPGFPGQGEGGRITDPERGPAASGRKVPGFSRSAPRPGVELAGGRRQLRTGRCASQSRRAPLQLPAGLELPPRGALRGRLPPPISRGRPAQGAPCAPHPDREELWGPWAATGPG